MSIPQALEFRGGSHRGLRPESSLDSRPFPETLFAMTMEDGEVYARTGEEFVDEDGVRRAIFRFDADGALAGQAQQTYCDDGNGATHE